MFIMYVAYVCLFAFAAATPTALEQENHNLMMVNRALTKALRELEGAAETEINVGCSYSLEQCIGLGHSEKECRDQGCFGDYCLTGMIQQSQHPRHIEDGVNNLNDCAKRGREEEKSYVYGNGACWLYDSMFDLDKVHIEGGAGWTVCTPVFYEEKVGGCVNKCLSNGGNSLECLQSCSEAAVSEGSGNRDPNVWCKDGYHAVDVPFSWTGTFACGQKCVGGTLTSYHCKCLCVSKADKEAEVGGWEERNDESEVGTIYVGNLPYDVTQEDVKEMFKDYGAVKKVILPKDRETGRVRGFGFVEMETKTDEERAIEALNGAELGKRKLKVNKARSRGPRGRREEQVGCVNKCLSNGGNSLECLQSCSEEEVAGDSQCYNRCRRNGGGFTECSNDCGYTV